MHFHATFLPHLHPISCRLLNGCFRAPNPAMLKSFLGVWLFNISSTTHAISPPSCRSVSVLASRWRFTSTGQLAGSPSPCWFNNLCVVVHLHDRTTVLTTLVVRKTYGMRVRSRRITAIFGPFGARLRRARQCPLWRKVLCASTRLHGCAFFFADNCLACRCRLPVMVGGAVTVIARGPRPPCTVQWRSSIHFTVHQSQTRNNRSGIVLQRHRPHTVCEIVMMFVDFATYADSESRTGFSFINKQRVHRRRRGCREFFNVLDAVPALRDRPVQSIPGPAFPGWSDQTTFAAFL